MLTQREYQMEMDLFKALIKLAKLMIKYKEENKDIIDFIMEHLDNEEKRVIYLMGVFMGITSSNTTFALKFMNNINYVTKRIKEGVSDEELIKEYERVVKEEQAEEFVTYGG